MAVLNDDPIIITDCETLKELRYYPTWISRDHIKEVFAIVDNVMLFVKNGGSRLPIIPDEEGDVYKLELGTKYFVDGARENSGILESSKKVMLYSAKNIKDAETLVVKNFERLRVNSLTDMITVASCVTQLQVTADDEKIEDRPLPGSHLKHLNSRKFKAALEEIAHDIKTCFNLEGEGNTKLREHAALTIRYFKEWNQFANIKKLRLDCSQLLKIAEDCKEDSQKMKTQLGSVDKKISELLQSLHIVNGCSEEEKGIMIGHKYKKKQEQMEVMERSADIRLQWDQEMAEYSKLRKKRETMRYKMNHPLHLMRNRVYDSVIGSFSNSETYVPRGEKDRTKYRSVVTKENQKFLEINRIEGQYDRLQQFMSDVDVYIQRLSCEVADINQLMKTIRGLRATLRSMEGCWGRYKEYFTNFLHFVESMRQNLHSFIEYNNIHLECTAAAPRVLEIVGYCTTLITAADIYDEVSERFARPIMFYYEDSMTKNDWVNQIKLQHLMRKSKKDAEEYIKKQNPQVLENALEGLQEFTEPYRIGNRIERHQPFHSIV